MVLRGTVVEVVDVLDVVDEDVVVLVAAVVEVASVADTGAARSTAMGADSEHAVARTAIAAAPTRSRRDCRQPDGRRRNETVLNGGPSPGPC